VTPRATARSTYARLGRALRIVARAVTLLVALQLSSVVHLAFDLLQDCDEIADCDDCPNEQPGHDCPPGCPNCHCAHPGIASLPAATALSPFPSTPARNAWTARGGAVDAPAAPYLPGLFRPPRPLVHA
jgi:hypothetical protein